jgi:hypothetical protein
MSESRLPVKRLARKTGGKMLGVIIAGACAGLVSGSLAAYVTWQMVQRRVLGSAMARRLDKVLAG